VKHGEIKSLLKLLRENGVVSASFQDGTITAVTLGDPPPAPPPRGVHAKRLEDDAKEAAEDAETEDPRFLLERIHRANHSPRTGEGS
jgi:hypothetical protein